MGVYRSISSKFKDFEDIKEELQETGLAKESMERYEDLYEEYSTAVIDSNKLNKKERKAEEEYDKENKKVKKVKEEMKELREKAGPLSRLKFSRVFFWSKEGRRYRNLKRRLRRAKARRDLAYHTLKELSAKAKGEERNLKQKTKKLKKSEKSIRKIWNQNKEEIKLIRNINANKAKLEEICDEKRQENIQASIEELQKEGDLPVEVQAKDLNKEIEEELKKLQENDTSKKEENEFKKSLSEGIVFGRNTTIDRRKIEMVQRNQNSEILRRMTPEEFMTYIGYVETKRRANEPVKYEDFINEMNNKETSDTVKFYAKTALKSLEKMKNDKSEEEIEKMDEGDKFIYGIAEDYYDIEEQEEEAKQEQKGMEIG